MTGVMFKRKICALCAILICLTAVICGCSTEENYSLYFGENISKAYYFSMNSEAVLTVYGGGNGATKAENAKVREIADGVYKILEDTELAISANSDSSDISRFNSAEAGATIEISAISYTVLSIAKEIYAETEGFYNPAVYYGVQAFGFNTAARYPKTEEELPATEITESYAELAAHFSEVTLSEQDGAYFVTKPNYTVTVNGEECSLKVDLGGIGKGYAADRVSEYLDQKNCQSAIFTFGDSSIAAKTYRGESFTLDLADPRPAQNEGGAYISGVQLKGECVSTSGDYVNYFEIDGVRYSHIFDPFTARPVQTGVMTATVIGGSAAKNDGYTTAIMAMGAEKSVEFINKYLSDCRVAFTFESEGNGYYYYTNMQYGSYTPADQRYKLYSPFAVDDGGENVS